MKEHKHQTVSIGWNIDENKGYHHCWCGEYFTPDEDDEKKNSNSYPLNI